MDFQPLISRLSLLGNYIHLDHEKTNNFMNFQKPYIKVFLTLLMKIGHFCFCSSSVCSTQSAVAKARCSLQEARAEHV